MVSDNGTKFLVHDVIPETTLSLKSACNNFLFYINEQRLEVSISKIREALNFVQKISNHSVNDPELLAMCSINVAKLLVDLRTDTASIVLGLLSNVTLNHIPSIENIFGKKQAVLVKNLNILKNIQVHEKCAKNLKQFFVFAFQDIRVLLVILASVMDQMRNLHNVSNAQEREKIALNTMEVYAPLAERVGLHKFYDELQDLAFTILHKDIRDSIVKRLHYLKSRKKLIVEDNIKSLEELLRSTGIKASVQGREKTPYSIWCKMNEKKVAFENLTDITAFRILVPRVDECYKVLMVIHNRFPAISEHFHDYISTPKMNGYRSLHTTVIGPQKERIEVQIRTYAMHEYNELGIAAHWHYKQYFGYDGMYQKRYREVKMLHEMLKNTSNPDEIFNTEIQPEIECSDQVFCFSSKGDFITLPQGATILDFAFTINSELGLTCKGARINGDKIVQPESVIENGSQIEILVTQNKDTNIQPSWEEVVVTEKAKSEIRHFLQTRQYTAFVHIGRALLIRAMKRKMHYNEVELFKVLPQLHKDRVEDLLIDIGRGVIHPMTVVGKLLPEKRISALYKLLYQKLHLHHIYGIFSQRMQATLDNADDIIVTNDTVEKKIKDIHIADCCRPIPGEEIIGMNLCGTAVVAHAKNCNIVTGLEDKNLVQLSWKDGRKRLYLRRLRMTIADEHGSLARVIDMISKNKMNIHDLRISNRFMHLVDIWVEIWVKDISELYEIVGALHKLQNVYSIESKNP